MEKNDSFKLFAQNSEPKETPEPQPEPPPPPPQPIPERKEPVVPFTEPKEPDIAPSIEPDKPWPRK